MRPPLIAFAGYARTGKDAAAKGLIARGYQRHNLGDVIKRQLDALCIQHLGFSAFTEDDGQKRLIRPTLEAWGDSAYDSIIAEYFLTLPDRCVNTRLVRTREAHEWRRRGGVIWEVQRPGVGPATQWEADRLVELRAEGLIDATVLNDGNIHDLHARVLALAGLE